jgi:hypothetical protein
MRHQIAPRTGKFPEDLDDMVGDTLERRGLDTLTSGRTKKSYLLKEHCQGPSFRSLYRLADSEFPNYAWLLRMWRRIVAYGQKRIFTLITRMSRVPQ